MTNKGDFPMHGYASTRWIAIAIKDSDAYAIGLDLRRWVHSDQYATLALSAVDFTDAELTGKTPAELREMFFAKTKAALSHVVKSNWDEEIPWTKVPSGSPLEPWDGCK